MKVKRSYDQLCPLAHALDIVGERWTLLLVRELLLGPRRFGELHERLAGIATNLLSERLRALRERGLVERDGDAYVLTPLGRGLEEPVLALARWGLGTLGPPGPDTTFHPDWLALTLRATARPAAAAGPDAVWELRVDGSPLAIALRDGAVDVRPGPAAGPELVATVTLPALLGLGRGARTADEALASGDLRIAGSRADLDRLLAAVGAGSAAAEPSAGGRPG